MFKITKDILLYFICFKFSIIKFKDLLYFYKFHNKSNQTLKLTRREYTYFHTTTLLISKEKSATKALFLLPLFEVTSFPIILTIIIANLDKSQINKKYFFDRRNTTVQEN